ncbi:MAG TPA: DUF6677 family protein [Vicinamibacterales bacterium]|nr:DUF6677 family protein [Vicinamibacterales bacterium]
MAQPTPSQSKAAARAAETAPDAARVTRVCAIAILVPGLGHALVGQSRKAAVFFVVLMTMFAIGLAFGGRLLPFTLEEPLVFLGAAAQWVLLAPRILAGLGGLGAGDVVAATYEYGNTFLIVAGLLNALVTLDVFDIATGRKRS